MKDIFKWELISEEDVSPSKWFPIFKQKLRVSPDKIIDDFYLAKLDNVVMIAPFTSRNKFMMVRQYKRGANMVDLEFPAGMYKTDEDVNEAAKRELREETGVIPERMTLLGKSAPLSTKCTMIISHFIAYGCDINTTQELDNTEDIEVVEVAPTELLAKIKAGELVDSGTIATVTFLQNIYPEIFAA